MEIQVSLLSDGASEFVEGFHQYTRLVKARRRAQAALAAARAFRSLYIALEKTLKSVVFAINPYLLVDRLEAKLLLSLTKDLDAQAGSTILLSRVPFETPSLIRTWELVRQLRCGNLPADTINSFERALKQFAETRHRVQHSELVSDRGTLVAQLEQVLQGVRPIVAPLAPEFLAEVRKRNAQVEARLQAIEERIEGNWSVLIHYLREKGGLELRTTASLIQKGLGAPIVFLINRSYDSSRAQFLFAPNIPPDHATGYLAHFFTPEEAVVRETYRRLKKTGQAKPVPVLDAAALDVPTELGWMTLRLPGYRPSVLTLPAMLLQFRVELSARNDSGTVSGFLIGISEHDQRIPAAAITGTAQLRRESAFGPTAADGDYPEGVTWREIELTLRLTATTARVGD